MGVICLAGPTASGKTALAVELAKEWNGEVVSCDSMQVYRRMDIGTAKPTREEMQGIPHHMIDVADPEEDFSVSRYCAMATPVVEDILRRGKTAIVAGGTGLYMDALIRGNAFAPAPADGIREALEERAERQGMEAMLEELRRVDPETASRLHPADRKRVLRALEVYYQTGRTIAEHNRLTKNVPPRFDAVWIGLDFAERSVLYDRIERRVDEMLQRGLLEEIRALLDSGVPEKATAMQAIGYKEFVAALDGRCTVEEAAGQVKLFSRRYAKRQLTWFRRNDAMHWIIRGAQSNGQEILLKARQILRQNDK